MLSDRYPPGVSGNEPQITGEWPCYLCGGEGGSREDGSCWYCGGSGIHPEEAPKCPDCNSENTDFYADLTPAMKAVVTAQRRQVNVYDEYNVLLCHDCGEVNP